jgi:3-oxoacyl-[acyl-carrier protein] reductase
MTGRLQDNVYVVTGAAGGIGAGVARRLATDGANLVLADTRAEALQAVARAVRDAGRDASAVACDLTDASATKNLAEHALAKFGRLDGCVPCAGIIRLKPVRAIDPQQWDAVMNVNLRGAFFTVQAIGNAMIARGCKGSIVTVSSSSSFGPRPNSADYGVSKAGINHLTRTFALDLAAHGIRVNAVSPGVIDVGMFQQVDRERGALLGMQPGELTKKYVTEIPLARTGTADDVASVVAFLLSDESSYVTGQNITIDGGFLLNHT